MRGWYQDDPRRLPLSDYAGWYVVRFPEVTKTTTAGTTVTPEHVKIGTAGGLRNRLQTHLKADACEFHAFAHHYPEPVRIGPRYEGPSYRDVEQAAIALAELRYRRIPRTERFLDVTVEEVATCVREAAESARVRVTEHVLTVDDLRARTNAQRHERVKQIEAAWTP